MNKAEQKFMDKGIFRGGLMLFSKQDAINFIKECKAEKIPVLGIDGFYIEEYKTQPSLENSIDFSNSPWDTHVYDKAIDFLKDQEERMFFEIVTDL